MGRIIVEEAEKILDKEFKVLDKGFVRLVDYFGGDDRIVQAARVSYGDGTKTVRENEMLIDYLMAHDHTSPFEHVVFEFHCKMPVFVARQWIRHRTGRVNEVSGRYSVMRNEFYTPPSEQVKLQSMDNKQGRGDIASEDLQEEFSELLSLERAVVGENYRRFIEMGVAKELARIDLPLSVYTEWYWQMDLHNLLNFLRLRMDSHAQWEIRQYANVIGEIVKTVTPMAWKAFDRHVLRGTKFSAEELDALKSMVDGVAIPDCIKGQRLIDFKNKIGDNGHE
jgi:thymidylate synthase (FAD)